MIQVVFWHWIDPTAPYRLVSPFTADKVRRAAAMVRGNLNLDHELVVITDQPEADYGPDIRKVKIWDDLHDKGRCWRRLKAFDPSMREVIGPRFIWLDIDCVVTGDLTPLVDRKEPLVLWQPNLTRTPYNGSMVLMTAGARGDVWSTFDFTTARQRAMLHGWAGSDQTWWSHVLGPNMPHWTPEDGVCSFWMHCKNALPPHARIVFFPGSLKDNGDWVRQRAPWVAAHLDAALPINEPAYDWTGRAHVPGRARYRGRATTLIPTRKVKALQ